MTPDVINYVIKFANVYNDDATARMQGGLIKNYMHIFQKRHRVYKPVSRLFV